MVNQIIADLQAARWSEHSEVFLLSCQGKLAALQANVSHLLAQAQENLTIHEINAKNAEADAFLIYKLAGKTDGQAKAQARLDCKDKFLKVASLKRELDDLRGVLGAMSAIQTAIQVQLRVIHREATYVSKLNEV